MAILLDQPKDYSEALVDAVWNQIQTDFENSDLTAIYELLEQIDQKLLENFVYEDTVEELKEKWCERG